jgi:hypothetical protein
MPYHGILCLYTMSFDGLYRSIGNDHIKCCEYRILCTQKVLIKIGRKRFSYLIFKQRENYAGLRQSGSYVL